MTYEYLCGACGHEWEAEQSINDKPLKKCPRCAKNQARRLISGGTGFVLKGGGWYADLYSSPKPAQGGDKQGDDSGGAEQAASKQSDSKSDSAGQAKTGQGDKKPGKGKSGKKDKTAA